MTVDRVVGWASPTINQLVSAVAIQLPSQFFIALVLDAENQGILVETFKGAIAVKTTSAAPQFWQELQTRFGHLANLSLETMKIVIINNTFF